MTPRQCRHNEAKEIQEKGENVAPLHPLIAAHPLCAPKRFWRLTIITTCLFWCLTSHYLQTPHLGSPHSLLIFLGNYSRHILAFLGLTSHQRELLLSNFRLFFWAALGIRVQKNSINTSLYSHTRFPSQQQYSARNSYSRVLKA